MLHSKSTGYILYACAGCSRGGQAAYKIAIKLDEIGAAEMSCLAGIASGGKSFFRKIKDKKIAVIDGCPVECARKVLTNQGLLINKYFALRNYGISKNVATTSEQQEVVIAKISEELIQGY